MAAGGTGFIHGYNRGHLAAERPKVVKLLAGLGEDENAPDNYCVTPHRRFSAPAKTDQEDLKCD